MAITLKEFLDENQHRNYPLNDGASARDETNSMNLPQTLMSDMVLNVPDDSIMDQFYVSNVVIRSMSVDITVSYYNDGDPIEIGVFSQITVDAAPHTTYQISVSPQIESANKKFEAVTGAVVVGLLDDTIKYPGSWTFNQTSGQLTTSVVHTGLMGVRQVVVGSDTFTGSIVLKEGTNVTLDSEYDVINDKYIITISAGNVNSGLVLKDDQDVFDALVNQYGTPLTRINGIPPADDGNFVFSGLDCTNLSQISGGLTIDNPCSKPCCDKSYLDSVYDNLAELNSRYSRIIDFYTEVSSNINNMQNKLAMLQLNTNIDL